MATVTGLTAARMLAIEAESIVDGDVVGDNLILTRHDGVTINAGSVRGPVGPAGGDSPTRVVALPGAPFDGQEIYFVADDVKGILWRFKYHAASVSAYKWEFVGGSSFYDEVETVESTNSLAFTSLTTAGPSITLPLAGEYDIQTGFNGFNDAAGGDAIMSYAIGATAAVDADRIESYSGSASSVQGSVGRNRRKIIAASAQAIVSKYRRGGGGGNATFEKRWMRITPVRVG